MPTGSANKFPKLILEERASDGSDTSNPAADHRALFLGEDGDLHLRDSSGTVTDVGGGGGAVTIRGHVNADGTVAAGSGFTASKTATGSYTVTFSSAFAAAPVCVASVARTGAAIAGRVIHVLNAATGSVDIRTRSVSPDDPIDSEFTFIAIAV